MKLAPILVALLAGLVGAAAGSFLLSPPQSSPADVQSRVLELERLQEEQAKRIADLHRTIDELTFDISNLEAMPRPAAPPRLSPAKAAEAPSDSVSSAPSTLGARQPVSDPASLPSVTPTPEFRSMVKAVLDEQKAEEEARLRQEAEERRAERVERQVERATRDLGLTSYQTDGLRRTLLDYEQARADLLAKLRDEEDFEARQAFGQSFRAIRDNRENQLKQILAADQYDKYQTLDRSRSFGGNFGGGGFGGGGTGSKGQKAQKGN